MQSARDFVALAVELAASMQGGEDHFDGRFPLGGMDVDRDAASIVADGGRAIGVHDDLDVLAIASQGFVDAVVHHFVDAVVEPAHGGIADVHGWTFTDSIDSLEDCDVCGVV